MLLTDRYPGANSPFKGDHTIVLRSLPADAHVTGARITLTPSLPPGAISGSGADPFLETFAFGSNGAGSSSSSGSAGSSSSGSTGATFTPLAAADWGVTRTTSPDFVEVAFHSRYTLAAVSGLSGATAGQSSLQIDLGGVYADISQQGAMRTPTNPTAYDVVAARGVLPGLTVDKFKISQAGSSVNIGAVSVRSVPANVSVRLGTLKPFWAIAGELAVSATSDDFSAVLTTFLSSATIKAGCFEIPFVLHSDTLARLDLEIALTYVHTQSVLPPHLPQVTLPFAYSSRPGFEGLTTAQVRCDAMPIAGATNAQVRGQLDSTRVAQGTIGDDPPTVPVTVSPAVSLAQPFIAEEDIDLLGIDLSMGNTEPALSGLNLAIRTDEGGRPSQTILAGAPVAVAKPLPGQSGWRSAALPAALRLVRGERYWIVLQSVISDAEWSAARGVSSGRPALMSSSDGGMSWRSAISTQTTEPLAALYRLRNQPPHFSIPIQLQIGSGAGAIRRTLDEYAPLGRVEFTFDFAQQLQAYLDQAVRSDPCAPREHLANGDFTQPPADDATRRLFGIDATLLPVNGHPPHTLSTRNLSRGVDLSRERYITIGVSAGTVEPTRIDCAGINPARTSVTEVADTLARSIGQTAVQLQEDGTILISSRQIVLFLACRPIAPDSWSGEPGQTYLVTWPDGSGRTVVMLADSTIIQQPLRIPVAGGSSLAEVYLGCSASAPRGTPPPQPAGDPASLTQQVSVTPGCTYRLTYVFGYWALESAAFRAMAVAREQPAPPLWQVTWLDRQGRPVRTDTGTFPLPAPLLSAKQTSPFWRHGESSLTAPAQASQAQISFIHPGSNVYPLLLAEVSLTPGTQGLSNGSFDQWQSQAGETIPASWTPAGGSVDSLAGGGVLLTGDGSTDTSLSQVVPVAGGEAFELRILPYSVAPSAGDPTSIPLTQRPRVEVRWQGHGAMETVTVPLDEPGFPLRVVEGAVPSGATEAEIVIIQPRGQGSLSVESVSFSHAAMEAVPLTFLSEAPGQLTVSSFQVSYDLPAATSLSLPAVPSAPSPGTSSSGSGTVQPAAASSSAGSAVAATPSAGSSTSSASVSTVASTQQTAISSLIDVPGVGPARAQRLAANGIDSAAALATATPQQVAGILGRLSPDQAGTLIAGARRLTGLSVPAAEEGA